MRVLADRPVGQAGAGAEVAEGLKQFVDLGLASAPCGVKLRRAGRHDPQALRQPQNVADGAADLVVVVPSLAALDLVQLIGDGVDARLGRVAEAHRGQRVLVHVAQRVVAKDAADTVDASAGGRSVSAEHRQEPPGAGKWT